MAGLKVLHYVKIVLHRICKPNNQSSGHAQLVLKCYHFTQTKILWFSCQFSWPK